MQLPEFINQQRQAVDALCARLHVRRLDLFGSAVRPDFDAQSSDLDFVVAFDELPPVEYADAFFALKEGLEQLFGRPVDLVVEQAIRNPHFKARIEQERQPVHAG
ncbi:MAG TPA: nucleotidyltransferase domain-containing protein [Rubrivivax sp.]|nr:nucleotidyltransferase domain-containing protein [Rubrivivax sp.]